MYTFEQLRTRIEQIELNEPFDLVVAIANGGIIPAALLNQRLGGEFHLLKLSLRDASQRPLYDRPRLLEEPAFAVQGKRVLLVEDRVKSGATLQMARELLERRGAALVKTFAVNGPADYSLLDVPCFKFPWILT